MDYEKILKGIVQIINTAEKSDIGFANICTYIGENCPELEDSEDERIRKALFKMMLDTPNTECEKIYNISKGDALAWLEKQGEQNPNSCDGCINRKGCINCENGDMKETEHKVEPKFKIGDWITNGVCIIQITSVDDRYYWHDNDCVGGDIESIDKEYHVWTIQDVKDGDVLVYNNSSVEIILLFKRWMDGIGEGAYSYVHTFKNEILFNDWSDCGYTTHPATKEQCDLLFQKMKEAGYEWDTEKKELRKIEKQGEQKNKINSYKFTFEDVLALECSMKTAKITKGGDKLYEILVPLYNKIHNAYLDEKQGEIDKASYETAEKEKKEDSNINDETNAPTEYGKYVDKCLNEASKHFFSQGEDKYSVADLFYAGIKCGENWFKKQGEKKSMWTENDEGMMKSIMEDIENARKGHEFVYTSYDVELEWLESLKKRMEE